MVDNLEILHRTTKVVLDWSMGFANRPLVEDCLKDLPPFTVYGEKVRDCLVDFLCIFDAKKKPRTEEAVGSAHRLSVAVFGIDEINSKLDF